ncbi:MAG: hypothetical protein ACR2HN_02580 [Tepidiformaceae bacterium]
MSGASAAVATVVIALLLALAAACGGTPSSLAEPAPCAQPTPGPERTAESAYRAAVVRGVGLLRELNEDWVEGHPSRKISNNAGFRADFAAYADESICIAAALRDLQAPFPKYSVFERAFDAEMEKTIEVQNRGRTAVSRRNSSDFKGWNRRIDARTGEIAAVIAAMPPR